jgi:hypothetical protein
MHSKLRRCDGAMEASVVPVEDVYLEDHITGIIDKVAHMALTMDKAVAILAQLREAGCTGAVNSGTLERLQVQLIEYVATERYITAHIPRGAERLAEAKTRIGVRPPDGV